MNNKFLKVCLSIIIFTLAFSLLFKLLFEDKTTYGNATESLPMISINYSGFEEGENDYKIKLSLTYTFIENFKIQFTNISEEEIGQPIFYGKQEEKYLNKEKKVYPYLAPNEERIYCFNVLKGLKFDISSTENIDNASQPFTIE